MEERFKDKKTENASQYKKSKQRDKNRKAKTQIHIFSLKLDLYGFWAKAWPPNLVVH